MKIEALVFDLGKVLVDFKFETAVEALHSRCSILRVGLEDVLSDGNCIRRYECGEISTIEFHSYLCETAGLQMTFPDFCCAWSSVFLPDLIVSEDLIATLKRKYPLILVSNTNEAHIEFIRANYRILDYFDHEILSYEVGCMKPDRRIFDHAIAISGLPAEALFFTDDREENVLAARQLGMQAHQFTSESNLIEALQQAGVT